MLITIDENYAFIVSQLRQNQTKNEIDFSKISKKKVVYITQFSPKKAIYIGNFCEHFVCVVPKFLEIMKNPNTGNIIQNKNQFEIQYKQLPLNLFDEKKEFHYINRQLIRTNHEFFFTKLTF